MTNPKPFYELPKPPRKRYGVMLVEITDEDETCMSTDPAYDTFGREIDRMLIICKDRGLGCNLVTCGICGRLTCNDHLGKRPGVSQLLRICQSCAALPPDVREAVRAFREQVNR